MYVPSYISPVSTLWNDIATYAALVETITVINPAIGPSAHFACAHTCFFCFSGATCVRMRITLAQQGTAVAAADVAGAADADARG